MRWLITVTLCLLFLLQYTVWFGQSGFFAQKRLPAQLEEQKQRVSLMEERNFMLTAEVMALKTDERALEARAREDLGLIREGEVFYLVPTKR